VGGLAILWRISHRSVSRRFSLGATNEDLEVDFACECGGVFSIPPHPLAADLATATPALPPLRVAAVAAPFSIILELAAPAVRGLTAASVIFPCFFSASTSA
jgi:hypothetical protein